jgi:hypothetical protein
MRTENLTLAEAVQAMKDGRCSNAARPVWPKRQWLEMGTDHDLYMVSDTCGTENFMPSAASILATDYFLVNPVIPTEEREVKGWAIVRISDGCVNEYSDTKEDAEESLAEHHTPSAYRIAELTGKYSVPVPPKKVKSISVPVRVDKDGYPQNTDFNKHLGYPFRTFSECHGKTGTLTFTWED